MLDRYDQDLLLDYLEDELDADRRAQIQAMLAEDPQLAALLHEMAMDRAALRSLPEAQAPGDLVHDVTSTLERKMLLDGPTDEPGPIPISRGRGMDPEPARGISWGRVAGLTGLAASVALAAGVVVITLDDPLKRTANELAATAPADEAEPAPEAFAVADSDTSTPTTREAAPAEERDDAGLAGVIEGLLAEDSAPAAGLDREPIARAERPPMTADPRRLVPEPEPEPAAQPDTDAALARFDFGSTAAISVIEPRQQLVLLSESPEISREQLFEFCVDNGIPIVQPEELVRASRAGEFSGPDAVLGIEIGGAAGDTQASFGDYALLINDSQLDTLVRGLNNDVVIAPDRAGKASPISNQAAVLSDLPDETAYRYYGRGEAPRVQAPSPEQADEITQRDEKAEQFVEQQAIQLQLPEDLGSDYANSRNAYNLQRTQQHAGYAQPKKLDEALAAKPEDAEAADAVQATPEPIAQAKAQETPVPGMEAALGKAPPQPVEREAATDEQDNRPDLAAAAEEETPAPPAPAVALDPARGNWLGAHLPVANTTPLLLAWRSDQASTRANLVHVMIKRAEPEKVKTLRLRQQAELASREEQAGADAETEADPEEAGEAEPAEQPEPAPANEPGDGDAEDAR